MKLLTLCFSLLTIFDLSQSQAETPNTILYNLNKTLFAGYNQYIRPVCANTDCTTVNIRLSIKELIKMVKYSDCARFFPIND